MITSTANPGIVAIRKLADSKHRKQTGLFLAEGLKAVGQAFDSHAEIQTLVISPEELVSDYGKQLAGMAENLQIPVLEVSARVFETIARKDKPQGIAAVIKQKWVRLENFLAKKGQLLLALESIQNPGNLGTILRTCDATSVAALILLDDSTDPYDPAAVKASMGSVFTVPLIKADLKKLESWLSHFKFVTPLATSDQGESDYVCYRYPETPLFLMGSERQGLSAGYKSLARTTLRIPMSGACDSLNLSVATGVFLFQAYNQKRTTTRGG